MGEVFLKLLNMSMTAGWLILAVLCVRFLFRKMPRWIYCVAWGMVAVRLVVPFSIESAFSLLPSAEPIRSDAMVEGEFLPFVPSIDSNLSFVEDTVNPILAEAFAYQETDSVAPLQIITGIAGVIWISGMILLLLYAAVSMIRLRLGVREAVRYKENIYLCDWVKSPFILGILRPRIYVSSALREDEADYIIVHEKAHLKRKDHLWKPFGFLLLCIYWFNPLCWIAYILLCKDIELACDEKVIKKMSFRDRKQYSRVLLSCATQRRLVFACPLAFGEVGVKERVRSVLRYKKPAFWISAAAIAACVAAAVCFLTNPSQTCQVRITVPAGSTAAFCYSEEEISPQGKTLTLTNGDGLGDTAVILLPVEVREENAYEPTYMTPGMPVKMDVEKNAWYKIGVNVQNPTTKDKDFYVSVKNVEIRVTSEEAAESGNDIYGAEEAVNADLVSDENAPLKDLAYYLELSVPGLEFRDMSEKEKTVFLSEYDTLLDGYTLMARESTDGKTAYIVGHYNAEVTDSPLYKMQYMYYTSDKRYQILYREENYEAMDRIKEEQGVQAITDEGYVIENSSIIWPIGAEYIFLQPTDVGQEMYSAFSRYLDPARGRRYIEDALSRGIAVNDVKEPYLSIYMISEEYGEITEKIPLTEEAASGILEEELLKLTPGHGFGASLHMNGESHYYSESKVPQSVLNLAAEKCGYRFESPENIAAPIIEACFDCSWLEEPLYLEQKHLSRLEEILKGAKFDGVGNCGYGAKLTLTLENGETITVFKGTDDCGSLVFGSWGGYSLRDEADDEFWELFGLSAEGHERFSLQDEKSESTVEDQKVTTENPGENTGNTPAQTIAVDASEVAGIEVVNGNTGERKILTAEDAYYEYHDLLKLYRQLDFTAESEENTRVGYQYSMKLQDTEGNTLQNVTPYKDGVTVNRIFYQYDNTSNEVAASLRLMEYLEYIFAFE
ncbi:MAG: hypothetical protein IKC46_15285 [Lachnospiraceae bacterium]|nr:hypothetical protein [Lachnospiraceae bacterium]